MVPPFDALPDRDSQTELAYNLDEPGRSWQRVKPGKKDEVLRRDKVGQCIRPGCGVADGVRAEVADEVEQGVEDDEVIVRVDGVSQTRLEPRPTAITIRQPPFLLPRRHLAVHLDPAVSPYGAGGRTILFGIGRRRVQPDRAETDHAGIDRQVQRADEEGSPFRTVRVDDGAFQQGELDELGTKVEECNSVAVVERVKPWSWVGVTISSRLGGQRWNSPSKR